MKQVFVEEACQLHSKVLLDTKQAHHLFDVLRIEQKETVRVISKQGGAFLAKPLQKPYLYITDEIEVPATLHHITLCCALIKQDRFPIPRRSVKDDLPVQLCRFQPLLLSELLI